MSFEALTERLNQVADLAKALPADAGVADDKKIAAAAAEGEGDSQLKEGTESATAAAEGAPGAEGAGAGAEGNPEDDEEEEGEGEGAPEGEAKPLAKSFSLALEDGTVVEAFDGSELLKSFSERLEVAESGVKATEEQFIKAMNVAVDLISTQGQSIKDQAQLIQAQAAKLAEQGALVKSLQERVDGLANAGRGRISTVNAAEKPGADGTLSKAMPQELSGAEILAKAQGALAAGRISGLEASGIETRLNMGVAIEPSVLAKIQ